MGARSTRLPAGMPAAARRDPGRSAARSLAQAEFLDQRLVAVGVAPLQVVEQPAPARHHAQQAAPRMVVLQVILEMVVEAVDARGEQRDLHLGRAGVAVGALVVGDDLRLFGSRDGHGGIDPYDGSRRTRNVVAGFTRGKGAILARKTLQFQELTGAFMGSARSRAGRATPASTSARPRSSPV